MMEKVEVVMNNNKKINMTINTINFEKLINEVGEDKIKFVDVPRYFGSKLFAYIGNKLYQILNCNSPADLRVFTMAQEYHCRHNSYRGDVRWFDYEKDDYDQF